MKLRSILFGTVALASTAAMAVPADAATFLITYTGTVYGSADYSGAFGAANSSLDGQAFTAVYTLTDPTPGAYTYDDGVIGQTSGGSAHGAVPSPVSATLTINGITQAISGDYYGQAYQVNDYGGASGYDQVYHFAQDYDLDGGSDGNFEYSYVQNYIYSYANDIVGSSDYTAPLNYTVQPGDEPYGYFHLNGYTDYGDVLTRYAYGYLAVTTVTIAAAPIPGAVPEPATWAMMIAGLGTVGYAMRRRRVRVAFA